MFVIFEFPGILCECKVVNYFGWLFWLYLVSRAISYYSSNSDFIVTANVDELDEKAKPVIQRKGRFKVTSENVDLGKVTFYYLYSVILM